MLDLLSGRERTAGALVRAFPRLSQPAVSKHLRVLREAGLVDVRAEGPVRLYRLRPGHLRELDAWVSHYRPFWAERLDALTHQLDRSQRAAERPRRRSA